MLLKKIIQNTCNMNKYKAYLAIAGFLTVLPSAFPLTKQQCFDQDALNLKACDGLKNPEVRSACVAAAKEVFEDCMKDAASQ